MKQYLVARPETIRSILQEGKLPEALPNYLKDHQLYFFDSPQEAAINSSTLLHQTFIVQLDFGDNNISDRSNYSPDHKKRARSDTGVIFSASSDVLVGKNTHLPVSAVEQVICYSDRGKSLLINLLKKSRLPSIMVDASLFSASNTPVANSSSPSITVDDPKIKRTKTGLSSSSSSLFSVRSPTKSPGGTINTDRVIQRLSTPAEHITLLKQALVKARKSLLITSYDISHQALVQINFYTELEQTLARGVKVYIYFNDVKGADTQALSILRGFPNVMCEEAFTHSKFLCVDKQWVSIGSFNWLSSVRKRSTDTQSEASLVSYHKALNHDLLDDIWKHLRFYRNIQFENYRAVRTFERSEDNYTTATYELDQQSELEYIPSLDQHCGFLQEMLETAKRKIIICSPFLSMRQILTDIDKTQLRTLSNRGVSLFIVTSSQNHDYPRLASYITKINSDCIHIIDHSNFHLKTLIVDDEVITEGSFNWLSAVRDEESEFHNHEATLLVRGSAASALIQQFYDSPIGQKILGCQAQNSTGMPDITPPQATDYNPGSCTML